MVLSRPQVACLCYLETSLTVLQNYRTTAFVNLWLTLLEELKRQKANSNKIDKEIIKKAS